MIGNDHSRSFENQTIRNIVHVSVGGRRVRVRISNAFVPAIAHRRGTRGAAPRGCGDLIPRRDAA